jgi:hypothetical protein
LTIKQKEKSLSFYREGLRSGGRIMSKIATYKGKPIEELTKEELIIALNEMVIYYESRLDNKDKIINLYTSKGKS